MARPNSSKRAAGVLLHPTSLPGGHGIGDLGQSAREFVDWLSAAECSYWQILPLTPPGHGDSPYFSNSALAGNPLLVDLHDLVGNGLLEEAEIERPPAAPDAVDYVAVRAHKLPLIELAAARLLEDRAHPLHRDANAFRKANAGWLEDAALFLALHEAHERKAWWDWPAPLRDRTEAALDAARGDLAEAIARTCVGQFFFERQWQALRRHCHERGIRVIGDMPIYVDGDSADVWQHRDLFTLDKKGRPTHISGVPPDAFSATGQVWGSPLYRWKRMANRGFGWWIQRMRRTLSLTDCVRIDHFRGLVAFWKIPAGAEDARAGTWRKGPGIALFEAMRQALGELPIIAEDLGLIDEPVVRLRRKVGLPGMRVLQFAFGDEPDSVHLPHNHTADSVVYTGTHDNDTTRSWWESAPEPLRDHVRNYLGVSGHDVVWDLIRTALASVAETTVIPMQDLLTLGADARMNDPATGECNWRWRVRREAFNEDVAGRFRHLIRLYRRHPGARATSG